MAIVGPLPTPPHAGSDIPSHTSTHQWQSFEFRMRHRRLERCLLRAEIALEADCDDDAREALDEAARLNSDDPRMAALRARLEERAAAAVAVAVPVGQQQESYRHRHRFVKAAAAALIFLAVGAGAFTVTRLNSPAVISAPPADSPSAPLIPQSTDRQPSPAPAPSSPVDTPIATAGQGSAEVLPQAVAEPAVRVTQQSSAAPPPQPALASGRLPAFNPQFAEPPPVMLPPTGQAIDPASLQATTAPTLPEPPPLVAETPATAPASTASLARLGEALPASNVPAAARPAPPEDPAVIEAPRVRAVLSRYEAAYSGLNASAAQAVWPGVDERSLARAFDTLQSQQVSLGQCAVEVDGATANASCNGTITWTPKVGGGSQTAARQWRFELQSGNGTWQITRAQVR